MPKRKRTAEPSLLEKLEKYQVEISRALKAAKGFERQRLSKRLREDGVTPDKQERLEREVAVLKSLDLHQTARAHLSSSLLKVKSIATSTDLPEEIRAGVPKPELSPEEKAALHNVTSSLYSRKPVKEAVNRAIEFVCQALNVPAPGKGKQQPRKSVAGREDQEEQPSNRIPDKKTKTAAEQGHVGKEEEEEEEEVTDFEGFQSDVDEPGPALGESDSDLEAEEEGALSKYDHLLGSSSDDDDDDDEEEELYQRYRGTEKVNLDDISLSGSASEQEEDEPGFDSDDEQPPNAQQPSLSPSPPPAKKNKKSKTEKKAPATPGGSTFLPSLMGGYISGSESASDVDIAPPKKRRGQRARQAIWEKKYGASAKHLQKEQQQQQKGRDAGWDMRRGAVDPDGQRRTPWKKGVSNPFAARTRDRPVGEGTQPPKKEAPRKKDDEGPLHPSWEAAKKVKDAKKGAAFAGQKIVFD